MFQCGNAIAAQWNVGVIPKPASKGNVPASPELGYTGGNIRVIEVLFEIESQHFAKADGHIGISAEIEIQLHGIGEDTDPCGKD